MAQLVYGMSNKLRFANDNEFYYSIGFLVNQRRTEIYWEQNQMSGAWGSECRIHCLRDLLAFPTAFQRKFTAGNGRILHRINCNEYIIELVSNWGFSSTTRGVTVAQVMPPNYNTARSLVPQQYIVDFDSGYNR